MPDQNTISSRLKNAWNAFLSRDPTEGYRRWDYGYGTYIRPDRPRLRLHNEQTIVTAIYNRIALDVSAIDIRHVKLDDDGKFLHEINSDLNNCLSLEANIDQTARAFIQDIVLSMLDEGYVAVVPVDTDVKPKESGAFDILTMRTGKIVEWHPQHIKTEVYNDRTGKKETLSLSKHTVGIIENPLYAVINEPNSTMQRLISKLRLLDFIDEQNSSGKLDLIIQLPYVIKTDARRNQAEIRRKSIEDQLTGSKYGIAYTDGTERITQLNRPIENNLLSQIEYLTKILYEQLGITNGILDGSADEKTMLNYENRIIEPFVYAIAIEMKRKFLTKTARSQHQSIEYFKDPFKLVPVSDVAEIADKFTRNEIMTSNEIRQVIGMKPSTDPKADELRNKNINQSVGAMMYEDQEGLVEEEASENQNGVEEGLLEEFDAIDQSLDELEDSLKHYASPYYDPVKAHEYYMRTRELKGRKSTAGLNDQGRAAASYVKKRINDQRDSQIQTRRKLRDDRISSYKDTAKSAIESTRNRNKEESKKLSDKQKKEIDESNQKSKSEIESLNKLIKSMSKEEKARKSRSIKNQIAKIREENNKNKEAVRAAIQNERKSNSESTKSEVQSYMERRNTDSNTEREASKADIKRYRDEADSKYVSELDRMRSDSSLQRQKKR